MKYVKPALMIGIAALIIWGVYFIVSRQGEAITPDQSTVSNTNSSEIADAPQAPKPAFDTAALEQTLQTIANKYPSLDVGVSVRSASQDTTTALQGEAPFIAASTTKVIVAAYALNQVQSGSIALDDYIGGRTLKEQITRMIVDSDNTAWYALLEHFGYRAITAFGNQQGAPSFDAVKNVVTPADMALFIKNLHNGSIINSANVTFLEELMAQSNTGTIGLNSEFSNLIRKAGWLSDRQHLVGVIIVKDTAVSYAIYTKSTGNGSYSYAKGSAFINETLQAITAALQ